MLGDLLPSTFMGDLFPGTLLKDTAALLEDFSLLTLIGDLRGDLRAMLEEGPEILLGDL